MATPPAATYIDTVVVTVFSSGTKAVEYLRSAEGAAEGVVTDIRLSDRAFDGWEVARGRRLYVKRRSVY